MGGSPRYATSEPRARGARGRRRARRGGSGVAQAARSAVAIVAALVVAASGVALGPAPKALAAAGEATTWVGPLTGGETVWSDPANWTNGVPADGSIVVFDTPVQLSPRNHHLLGGTLEFRPGASGARLSSNHEFRPGRIVVGEAVAVELDLRLLQLGQYSELTIAMSDDAALSLTRQVQPAVFVESTKLVDGVGPEREDLRNAVIRIGSGTWLTAGFHLSGAVRLELDKHIAGNVHPVTAPVAHTGPTASPTAGSIVWLRDEQLFAESVLELRHGLTIDLNGRTQTLAGLALTDATASLSGGRLQLDTDLGGMITADGAGTSRIAGGTLAIDGGAPAAITVGAGTLEIASTLAGSADITVGLAGGTLVLGDACGYTGTLAVDGIGTLVAGDGFGGVLEVGQDVEYVDGSLGECETATVPPGPPTHVTAVALDDRIGAVVRWQWPTQPGTNRIRHFELYRSADPAALGTRIADIAPEGNVLEHVDEWAADEYLEGWTTYYYRVRAVTAVSAGELSPQVSVVTLGPPLPPPTVRVLGGSGKVKLTWSPSPSANVEGYRVYRSTTYAAPTADDPWAGAEPPPWSDDFTLEGGAWELVGELGAGQFEHLDDPGTAVPAVEDTVASPAYPLERTWNYFITAHADGFGESPPAVVVAGTPSSRIELTMSVFQEVDAYPGTTAVFAADVSNLGEGPTSGDLTARLLIPSAFPVTVLDPAGAWVPVTPGTEVDGDGDGVADWRCGLSTIGDASMLRCTATADLAGMSTSAPLPFALDIPASAALGTVRISYAVSGTNAAGELGAASSKPFAFEVEAIQRASLEVLTAFDGTLSPDPANPGLVGLSVRNTGTAATLAPPTLTIAVPATTRLGSGYGSDAWSCTQPAAGADIVCVGVAAHLLGGVLLPGAVSPELTLPLLTPATPWTVGSREALPIAVTAAAPDAYGTVTADAQLTGTPALGEAPALLVDVEVGDPAALPPGVSALRPAVTNGGGDTRDAVLGFALRLPDGVVIDLAAVTSAWSCAQTGTTLECAAIAPSTLPPGQRVTGPLLTTRPLSAALTSAGRWQVGVHAMHDGVRSEPVTGLVEIAPLPPPAASTLTIQPQHTPLRGGQDSSATLTLAGATAGGAAPARAFAALLPAGITATGVDVQLRGFAAATPATWGACGIIPRTDGPFPGAGDAVLCATTTPTPQAAAVDVTIRFTADRHIEGELPFVAGFVAESDPIAAVAALRVGGAGALLEPSVASVAGVAFLADAGAPQTVESAVITADATGEPVVAPTTVRLAGTVAGALGAPVAYCWEQVGGPPVTWVAAATSTAVPGTGGLPAFPAGAPAGCTAGGFDAATDHWFGEHAAFLAPQRRDGAEVTLRLHVTDGVVVADAQTTVTVGPAGNATPVIEEIALLRHDGADWVEVPDVAAAQTAGTPLRLRVRVADTDGDRVTLTPWLISPRSAGVVFTSPGTAAAPGATVTEHLLDFTWPTAVAQLDLGVTATDGFTTAGGMPSTTTATIALGPSPTHGVAPPSTSGGFVLPVTAPWRVARGLDLEGWVANGPIDVAAGDFGIGTELRHPLAIPDPEAEPDPEPDPDTLWHPGPLTLSAIGLTVVATPPPGCTVAADAPSDAVVLALRATADIDWNGHDPDESDFRFDVEGCIVAGHAWQLTNAAPIRRMDIEDVPKTLSFRGVSFTASGVGEPGGDIDETYRFVGTAQTQGADGPATMVVWDPKPDEPGYGATRFALWIETTMSDISMYYGGDGYLLYTPTELSSLSDIPGFELDRGAAHDADVCTGSPTRHEDIPVTAGFSAVTNYRVAREFCELVDGIGIRMAGTMPMITPVSAIPKGTIYLSGGETTLIDDPTTQLRATMTGVRLVFAPNLIQLISDGELQLPDLLHTVSAGRLGTPGARSSLDVGIGLTFGTNFVKEHTLQAFIQKTGGPWRDAFGMPGLDIGELVLQGGITLERHLVSTDSRYGAYIDWAFRAEVAGLPGIMEQMLGIVGDEPIVISTRFSQQSPIWDWQLGVVDGRAFMKPLKGVSDSALEDVLVIDGAHLIVAPFGGTIGDRIYPWGVTLDFALGILGAQLDVAANVDIWGFHMDAELALSGLSVGGIHMTEVRFAFLLDALDPTASFQFTSPTFRGGGGIGEAIVGITAGFEPESVAATTSRVTGPAAAMRSSATASTASPEAAPVATAPPRARADAPRRPSLTLDFAASIDDVRLGDIATLHDIEIWSHRELPLTLGLAAPAAAFDLGASATIGVLGHEVAVIGSVDIDAHGLKGYDLVGASEPLHIAGTAVTGVGCGDVSGILPDGAPPTAFPTNGPCVRVAVRPGTLDPVRVALSGSLQVPGAGLEATFDGQLDGAGLAIELARVRLTSAITASLTDARLYYGPRVAAGLVTDTTASGSPVVVANGDFRLRGIVDASLLGGFAARLDVDLGKVGPDAWATATAELALLADANSPIRSTVRLAGAFAKDGGDYAWELEGTGSVDLAGFRLTGVGFSLGEAGGDGWFTLAGQLRAGPVSARVAGDVSWDRGVRFALTGEAEVRMFGATPAAASLTIDYGPGLQFVPGIPPRLKAGKPTLTASLAFGGDLAGVIRLSGSGIISANGDFCVSGSARIVEVKGSASVCHQGGRWSGEARAEVWRGMHVAATLLSMHDFIAAGKVSLPTVKKGVNLSYGGVGLSGDFVIRDMHLTLGLASKAGTVCISVNKKGKCSESVSLPRAGLYVAGGAKFKVHGCVKGGALGKKCDNWSTGASFKANPVKFCGSKSFKIIKRWTISGCYEPPSKLYTT